MDWSLHDDSLNLDSSGTYELGRAPTVQGDAEKTACVEVPEPPRQIRCDTRHRELLSHVFAGE